MSALDTSRDSPVRGAGTADGAGADPLWRAVRLLDVSWGRAARAIGLGSLALASSVGLAAVAAWLIARASQMPPVLQLSVATVAVRAFGISRGVFRYLERLASHDVALRGMASLRANVYTSLASGRTAAVAGVRRGDLLARVGADVDSVGDVVVRAIIPAGVALVVSAGSVILVGVFLPSAGVALFLCLLLAGVLGPWLSARAARRTEERGAAARAEMTSTVLETLEGSGPLTVSGRLSQRMDALRRTDRELAAVTDSGARTSGTAAAINNAAIGLAVLASLLLGIPAVAAGTLAPVELAVIVLTPLAVFEAAGVLPAAAVQMHRSRQAARRIMELLDAAAGTEVLAGNDGSTGSTAVSATNPGPADLAEAHRAIPRATSDTSEAVAPVPEITVAGASCGWNGRAAVTGIDLTVSPGRAVAIVGPSGVGKTTLLMTTAGLIPQVAGHVSLDGSPISSLPPDDVAHQVVFVAEDGHVFDTTLLENLRVARGDVTPDEAEAALVEVGLGEWLAGLPDGVGTTLGPDATTISGGERRRLLVARALLAPAPLLLVDEPAEHLDPATADELLTHLVETTRTGGRGVVVATHRLSALAAADEVLLLGRTDDADPESPATVLARGTHAELIARDEGYRWALAQEAVAGR
ncbi:thiol reductant ABC exporter subunit CydC [Oerskovia enterophila]|uniref:ABC transporter ATP-binding protein n=1 Tax=Oerskovia enterophila TaxID=43678 RepID=A0ABX2Y8A8_9CELL|nr:thiol reductant ABC exporter subunit CydC [Oerskovia enterophila]OCI31166.1 putative ABC transporter ATP-binding protein [Oerskovia enterophila]